MTLGWKKNAEGRDGASPLIGYTVEYFSSDLQTGWVAAANRVNADTITARTFLYDARWQKQMENYLTAYYVSDLRFKTQYQLRFPGPRGELARNFSAVSSLRTSPNAGNEPEGGVPDGTERSQIKAGYESGRAEARRTDQLHVRSISLAGMVCTLFRFRNFQELPSAEVPFADPERAGLRGRPVR